MDTLLSHWPFVTMSLILAMGGQVAKVTVLTQENVRKYHGRTIGEVIWWGRKTLPMHPVVLGAACGFVPGMPVSPGVETLAAKVLYFAGAGIASTWAFAILKGVAKQKALELDLPRESTTPPAPADGAGPAEGGGSG